MLQIQGLSFETQGENEAEILKDINLELQDKKIYVITGPNGSGKSSLAKIIMGIYRATEGRIYLDGQDITDMSISERANLGIGYAFQNPPRYKGITVRELLQIALKNNPEQIDECDLLYDVGLCPQEYLDREADVSLSGGEMKRIEIATVLARNLKLAVFDEPEAGIDLWSFQKLAETFRKIHEKYDTTVVIISHQERILELADEIILMSDGQIKEKDIKANMLDRVLNSDACDCKANCRKVGE